MKWHLNRTGQPEGPYEEEKLLEMIKGKEVTSGNICEDGTEQWKPLKQHPPFAAALGGEADPGAGGYPAAPNPAGGTGGGYPAAPAGGGGYPPAPGAAGAGFGGAPAGPGGAAPAKKKGSMGLIIGVVAAVLVVAGAAVGAYFLFAGGTKPKLAGSVPKDVQVYFEIPDVGGAFGKFAEMGIIDADKLKGEKLVKDVTKALTTTFEISDEAAEDIVGSVESFAVAGRDVMRKDRFAVLISFSSAEGMDKLLDSERFAKEDSFGENGTRYNVQRLDGEPEDMEDFTPTEMFFAGMRFREESKHEALVWFPDQKLLVIGHPDFIEDISAVVEKGKDSLEDAEVWSKAQFESGSSAIAFVDAEILQDEDELKDIAKGYFDDVAPFVGSVKFDDAGVVMTLTGQLKGKDLPEEKIASAVDVDLFERLPKETVAYIAFSTKSDLTGKEFRKNLIKQVRASDKDAAKELDDMLDELDEEFEVSIEKIYDAIGDQAVLAVSATADFAYDPEIPPEENIADFAVAYIMHVGDQDAAEKIVKIIKEKLFEDGPLEDEYDVSKKGDGFTASPVEEEHAPFVYISFIDEHLIMAVGGKRRVDAVVDTFTSGKDTLDDVPAHNKALKALSGGAYSYMWFDAGRVGQVVLDWAEKEMGEQLDEMEEQLGGISYETLRVEGDDRMTAAAAFHFDVDDDTWNYKIETLNFPAVAAAAGVAAFLNFSAPRKFEEEVEIGRHDLPDVGDLQADTGIAMCDMYIRKVKRCARKSTSARVLLDSAKQLRDNAKQASSAGARRIWSDTCSKLIESVDGMPGCSSL